MHPLCPLSTRLDSHGPPKAHFTLIIGTQLRSDESPEESQARITRISQHVEKILVELGEDPTRDGIKKTPERYAKALLFLTRGYEMKLSSIVANFDGRLTMLFLKKTMMKW